VTAEIGVIALSWRLALCWRLAEGIWQVAMVVVAAVRR